MKVMTHQARTLRYDICRDIDIVGDYLHEGWERKRRLSPGISNTQVDAAYMRARAAGARGGKLLGAGGAGFLLVYAPGDLRSAVVDALRGYQAHSIAVDTAGACIIYAD